MGRWVMVAGGSSGIGAETARVLARAGWNVAIHYCSSKSAAEGVAEEVRAQGVQTKLFQADFSDREAGPRLVDGAWSQTGGFDAWFQNAGVDLLTGSNARLQFIEKLELATQVDLWGTMLTCREVGRRMVEKGAGVIVTVGWDQSATGMEGDSGELFSAVKGGIAAFSRSLAKSLAPKVRVHCVAPGWIKTAWGTSASEAWQERAVREAPLRRWGTPSDVAAAVAFLISDSAGFLTGQTLNVNGGVVAS